eukprot:TRINITY_DN2916_c1_g2_i2.p1 TRINITY_DN2916_c1_g2~~TRINITY_DN2916_c1_g2_i2.p1  ORF type:complete len:252 (-),score=78.94 TRINITY_DN2916_c1_g2_i2:47-802(-)
MSQQIPEDDDAISDDDINMADIHIGTNGGAIFGSSPLRIRKSPSPFNNEVHAFMGGVPFNMPSTNSIQIPLQQEQQRNYAQQYQQQQQRISPKKRVQITGGPVTKKIRRGENHNGDTTPPSFVGPHGMPSINPQKHKEQLVKSKFSSPPLSSRKVTKLQQEQHQQQDQKLQKSPPPMTDFKKSIFSKSINISAEQQRRQEEMRQQREQYNISDIVPSGIDTMVSPRKDCEFPGVPLLLTWITVMQSNSSVG